MARKKLLNVFFSKELHIFDISEWFYYFTKSYGSPEAYYEFLLYMYDKYITLTKVEVPRTIDWLLKNQK